MREWPSPPRTTKCTAEKGRLACVYRHTYTVNEKQKKVKEFFKQHKGLDKFLNKIFENNYKEIARGEVTDQDIIDEVKEELGIDIPKEYLCGPY